MSTIVSVDWDYFFPRINEFDWGHRESEIHWEYSWLSRSIDISMFNKEDALSIIVPDQILLENFWDKICPKGIAMLVISESHFNILQFLKLIQPDNCINYDTHHDYHYHKIPTKISQVDCSNWASFALSKKYTKNITWVHSPKVVDGFLKKNPKGFNSTTEIVPVTEVVDLLFICRSYAWTPTWSDSSWLNFVGEWSTRDPYIWNKRFFSQSTLIERHPTFEEAVSYRNKLQDQMKLLKYYIDTK